MKSLLLASLTAGLALGLVTRAAAQDDDARAQARQHFTTGVARFEAHDYQGALEQFQEAYRLAPHPSVRVNMANCYEQLDRPLEALHHYEGFLAESENPTPQQRREVQAAIRRLQGQLGALRLVVAPDGATVTIDDAETRRAPILTPIMLERGTHTLVVSADGFVTARQQVQIAGGDTQRVSIRLERGEDTEPAVASAEPEPTEPLATAEPDPIPEDEPAAYGAEGEGMPAEGGPGWSFTLSAPVVISGIATIVFAAAAITTGVLALDFNDQYEAAVVRVNSAPNEAERAIAREEGLSAADNANTLSILTDVFLITTIAAAGATIFFVIVDGMPGDDDDASARRGPDLRLGGGVTPEGGGVSLTGRF